MTKLAGPHTRFPEDVTIADLFEAQVRRTPDGVAVVDGDERLTYRELDERANRLARHLQDHGVEPDAPVAILLERSADLVIALLATLKAGGACLPVDPGYPEGRIAAMLGDARPAVLVTRERLAPLVAAAPGTVVRVDADRDAVASHPSSAPAQRSGPKDLAYVIYTSGSTGEPKGVAIPHRGLVNHNVAVARLYDLGPDDRVAQFCSIGFDVSIEEIFPTLETGGRVVLRPAEVPIFGREWLAWLEGAGITVLNLPTAYWHEWVRDLATRGEKVPATIRLVIVGGEKALGSAYRRWLEVGGDRLRWINAYGPAETSVLATFFEPGSGEHDEQRDPPIGRPLNNTTVYVLNEEGVPVAPGDVGELYIGGVGVARGYLNRPDLSAAAFVDDPARGRLYRTGDLARALEDGTLEFVGRRDDQVKVRGFRIEPQEVESALARHPAVAEVAVVAREDEPGEKRLVAYVAADRDDVSPRELRRFAAKLLPAYMVPSAFAVLEDLPLTPNGKLDRDALPPPDAVRPSTSGELEDETERAIAAIWGRVLRLDVGRDDDFFDLGGHSLKAAQILAEIRSSLGAEIGFGDLLAAPTVAALAEIVDAARRQASGPPPLERREPGPGERIPLTLSQEQMWHLEAGADVPGLFNVTAMHRFSVPVDPKILEEALTVVTARHEPLRTSFGTGDDGVPFQVVAGSVPVELSVHDLRALEPGAREPRLRRLLAAQDAKPFDLARAPLWRAGLYILGDTACVAATTFDHLVCDGTSAYVFLGELTAAIEALSADRTPSLRRLPVGYSDFARWQRSWLSEERLETQVRYWKEALAGMPQGPAVPLDRTPVLPSRRIEAHEVAVPEDVYARMRGVARREGGTIFVVTVAALQVLFANAGGGTDVVVSTTLSGRGRPEVEGLIGCFHNIGRIRTDLSGDPPFGEVLARARRSVLGLLEHQDVPFIRVRKEIMSDLPPGGPALMARVPIEVQYFHTTHDEWSPGAAVVERPGRDRGADELFFRGHLHPLHVTILDDGRRLWGRFSYKVDFYDDATVKVLAAGFEALLDEVTLDLSLRLSELTAAPAGKGRV